MSRDEIQTNASALLGMFSTLKEVGEEDRTYDVETQTLTHRDGALISPSKHQREN